MTAFDDTQQDSETRREMKVWICYRSFAGEPHLPERIFDSESKADDYIANTHDVNSDAYLMSQTRKDEIESILETYMEMRKK